MNAHSEIIADPIDPDDPHQLIDPVGPVTPSRTASTDIWGKTWSNGKGGVVLMLQAPGGWHRRFLFGPLSEEASKDPTMLSLREFLFALLQDPPSGE